MGKLAIMATAIIRERDDRPRVNDLMAVITLRY